METVTFKLSEQIGIQQRRLIRYMPFIVPLLAIFLFWFTPSLRQIWIVLPPLVSFGMVVFFVLSAVIFKVLAEIINAQQMAGLREVEIIVGPVGIERRKGQFREFFPFSEIERFVTVKKPQGDVSHIQLATPKTRLTLFGLTHMERLTALLDERLNPQVYRKVEQLRINWSHPVVMIFSVVVTMGLISGFISLMGGRIIGMSLLSLPLLLLSGFYFPLFRPISRIWGSSYRRYENWMGVLGITAAIIPMLIFPRLLRQDILDNPCYFITQIFQNSGCVKRIEAGDFVAFVPNEATVVVSDMQTVWFQPIGGGPFYSARPLHHDDSIQGFVLAANGQRLVSWSFGRPDVVSLWDVSERSLLHEEAIGNVEQMVIAPEGDYLGIQMFWDEVWLWQTDPWQAVKVFTETNGMSFSPDGTLMATLPQSETTLVQLWRVGDLTEAYSFPFPGESDSWGRQVAFSPDGRWLAAATGDSAIYVWRVADGSWQYTWQVADDSWQTIWGEPPRVATAPAFSPTGDILALGFSTNEYHNTVQLWSLSNGTLLKTIPLGETLQNQPQSLAFSSDGAFLAVATRNEVMVFEMAKLLP
jgi:hypothetical protein